MRMLNLTKTLLSKKKSKHINNKDTQNMKLPKDTTNKDINSKLK